MYDPDLAFLRELEVFNARRAAAIAAAGEEEARALRVHFLVYDTSLEEQKYLSALTREKVSPPFLASSLEPDVRMSCSRNGVTTGELDGKTSGFKSPHLWRGRWHDRFQGPLESLAVSSQTAATPYHRTRWYGVGFAMPCDGASWVRGYDR